MKIRTILCPACGIEMQPKEIGIKVRYGCYAGYFAGDLWHCPSCGKEIILISTHEIFDPNAEVDYDFGERE